MSSCLHSSTLDTKARHLRPMRPMRQPGQCIHCWFENVPLHLLPLVPGLGGVQPLPDNTYEEEIPRGL